MNLVGLGCQSVIFFFYLIFIIDLLTISIQLLYSNRSVSPPHRMMICEGCTEDGKELVMEHLMKVIASTGQEYAWGSAIQFTARGSMGLEIKCTIFANKVFHSPKSNTSITTPPPPPMTRDLFRWCGSKQAKTTCKTCCKYLQREWRNTLSTRGVIEKLITLVLERPYNCLNYEVIIKV